MVRQRDVAHVHVGKLTRELLVQVRQGLERDVPAVGRDPEHLPELVAEVGADVNAIRVALEQEREQEPQVLRVAVIAP